MTTTNKKATPRVEPKIAVGEVKGFTPPPKPARSGGNASKYPFDALEVGGFFSVKNKTRRQMLSPVGNANKKYRSEAKDASGKIVSTNQDREFYAVEVDDETAKSLKGTDHEGATVLIVRSK